MTDRKSFEELRLAREVARLEAANEMLEFRLSEILAEGVIRPDGVSRAKFRIASLLANRSPASVPYDAFYYAMSEHPNRMKDPNAVLKTQVCLLRQRLSKDGIVIENTYGYGYRMPPESAAKWNALVEHTNGLGEAA